MKNSKTFKVLLIFTFIISIFINLMPVYAAKKMTISDKIVTLMVGKSQQISIINKKKHKVKWTSNKKEVATVDSKGMITAKGVGVAKITGKVLGKKYTCTVKVSAAHLYSFEIFKAYDKDWGQHKDTLTNVYPNSINIYHNGRRGVNDTSLEYYLSGKYNGVSGKIAFDIDNEKDRGDLCLIIYADEKEVYRTGPINERTEPVEFDVDIANANFIKFSVEKLPNNTGSYKLILSDPILR